MIVDAYSSSSQCKRFCRLQNTYCQYATADGYCQFTACINHTDSGTINYTMTMKDGWVGMITQPDVKRIADDAAIAIDALNAIYLHKNRDDMSENYLKEKVKLVQGCLDFMKTFYKENN